LLAQYLILQGVSKRNLAAVRGADFLATNELARRAAKRDRAAFKEMGVVGDFECVSRTLFDEANHEDAIEEFGRESHQGFVGRKALRTHPDVGYYL
jgi:hypothetical protein